MESLLDEIKNKIQKLENKNLDKDNKEKLIVFKTSYDVLCKYKDHPLFKYEVIYQNYITKFSRAYVSISPWYVGDSYIDAVKNKSFLEFKGELTSEIVFLCFLNSFSEN